jgi:glycosyltransferase involved in cell wall biosynthesis
MPVDRPLVTIGIPVFNGERFIHETLDNLLAQTYDNIEFLIADNASTDRTGEICQEYAAKDRRIKYYRNAKNIGLTRNYRRVLELATGEYFMWAAIDDLKPANTVARCLAALSRNPRAVMAHGIVLVRVPEETDLHDVPNVVHATQKKAAERIRVFTRNIEHNTMEYGLCRIEALRRTTLGIHSGQDYLISLQMCLLGEIEYVDTPMIIFRQIRFATNGDPMYREVPLTLRNLFTEQRLVRRRKCWMVLIMGAYYLATRKQVPFLERLQATAAHITTFSSLYRARLGKEIVFQLFQPLAWFGIHIWSRLCQSSATSSLTRKVKARFIGI